MNVMYMTFKSSLGVLKLAAFHNSFILAFAFLVNSFVFRSDFKAFVMCVPRSLV